MVPLSAWPAPHSVDTDDRRGVSCVSVNRWEEPLMIRGSCLCGRVSFEFEEVGSPFRLCHCHRCQKASGSAFFAGFVVKGLRFLTGEEVIRSFEAPVLKFPPAYRRDFCECCGSPVPWPSFESGTHVVPAGSIDDDPEARP